MTDVSRNIAHTLTASARRWPSQRAVVFPAGRDRSGRVSYTQLTFAQLERESERLAFGLKRLGVRPGARIVLMVRPSLDFIALTYALFKTGAVVVLIDPGMGRSGVLNCLGEVQPEGFVALPIVQALRVLTRHFPTARLNVTVGRRWFWGGPTYQQLRDAGKLDPPPQTVAVESTDPAAIIFTSGSTGPPKGVVYEHGMFAAQVDWLRELFQIRPGEVDLPGFPLFALFNAAMGVTTVVPDMDPTRPAQVDPGRILEAIEDQGVTQAFGSPAIWNVVSRHCEQHQLKIPSLKRVLSAGAPVPVDVLRRMTASLAEPGAEMFTPYGATESLPVAVISAKEVLNRTAAQTAAGAGTCVGRPVPHIRVKIVEITQGPIPSLNNVRELPPGKVGEIIVRGAVVTREYFRPLGIHLTHSTSDKTPEPTALAKIADGEGFWHRMGDVGYLDAQGELWFCGRKAQIVETGDGPMFTECVEPIFNTHPQVFRSALVGIGTVPNQQPVLIVELEGGPTRTLSDMQSEALQRELREIGSRFPHTQKIDRFLFHPSLPVDVRHNVKIDREELSQYAERVIGQSDQRSTGISTSAARCESP